MNYKSIFKSISILLIIMFLALYISQATGYYNYEAEKKTTLTKEAIIHFEEDIKAGKEINVKNYLEEETNYNNIYTKAGRKLSSIIETSFQKFMNALMKEIAKTVNDK